MSQTTFNTQGFINDQVYSTIILEQLADTLLPVDFTRDITDFQKGTTYNIKTLGDVEIQEVSENTPIVFSPIDTGSITLNITDYVGDGWYVTDELSEDGTQVDQLMSARLRKSSRAMSEFYESKYLQAAVGAQTAANPNLINGVPHRFILGTLDSTAVLNAFSVMKYSFDKAEVPLSGRVAIVDPAFEHILNQASLSVGSMNYNINFSGVVTEGFRKNHKFLYNIYGWDVWTSNRLPNVTSETIDNSAIAGGGTTTITDGIASIFMCLDSDDHKPLLSAWRKKASVESERNFHKRRREYQTYSRFGLGPQRVDTLGVLITPRALDLGALIG
jgi:hypothetical protein